MNLKVCIQQAIAQNLHTYESIARENGYFFKPFFLNYCNSTIDCSNFPNHLKLAHIILCTL